MKLSEIATPALPSRPQRQRKSHWRFYVFLVVFAAIIFYLYSSSPRHRPRRIHEQPLEAVPFEAPERVITEESGDPPDETYEERTIIYRKHEREYRPHFFKSD